MYERLRATLAITLLISGGAAASAATPADRDRDFVSQAAQGGQFEVAAGKLAASRGLDPAVKEFGQRMITDHSAANDQLKSVADMKQWALEPALSPDQNAALGKLESLSGTEFDKTYTQLMVKDHEDDIAQFENELKKGKDADVKAYAQTVLPTLRRHLAMAHKIESQAKGS